MTTMRAEPTDEHHETQLREKPNDPNTHSNYGAYLADQKGETERAERAYRRALELAPLHVNALGNLANLRAAQGNLPEANALYRKAVDSGRPVLDENLAWNYARFLYTQLHDQQEARKVLEEGILRNPDSGRLLLLRATWNPLSSTSLEALEDFRRAREKGAEQGAVESGYACALHMSGAPIGECIAAYRLALTLAPQNGALRLNLSQLLFIKGDDSEAKKQLAEAMKLELDPPSQLEVQFYLLAHTGADPLSVARVITKLSNEGARLCWNLGATIDHVSKIYPMKAARLRKLAELLTGKPDQTSLAEVFSDWPT